MKTKHFLQLVFLSALWGGSFMLMRMASPILGPNVMAAMRIGLATATLAVLMRSMRKPWPLPHWRELMVLGILSVGLPFLLFSWAALQLPAGYSALLNATAVVFGLLTAVGLKEETLTARKLLGCACGLVGVALIVGLGPVNLTPEVALAALGCTLGAACYGVSAPLTKRALQRMPPLSIAAGIHAVSFVFLIPGAVWSWPQAQFTPMALAGVAIMGVVTSGMAYWMHIRILAEVSPVAAMSPTFMIPVFGVCWGHLLLGEQLGTGIFVGGAMVLLASALVTGFSPWRTWLDMVDAKP